MQTESRVNLLRALCEQFGVATLYVFGSRSDEARRWLASGNVALGSSASDLDVGVLPLRGRLEPPKERVRLANALEDLFAVRRVDLVLLPQADSFLAANVIRGERLYAVDPARADEYELFILARAGELVQWERERQALILARPR